MAVKEQFSVLVIEDNPGDFAIVEEFLLEQIGSPVIVHAENFKEAEIKLSTKNIAFNVILLDLSLPDKTGSELIQDIVQASNNIPVIVLTGYADFSFGVKSISQGVSDYILKDELTPLVLYKTILYSLERKKILLTLQESEKRVRHFAGQLNKVVEEERARIAREIHDEFGQQLTGIKMSLSILKNGNQKQNDVILLIDSIVSEVNRSIQTLREISNELRPALLDKVGLFASIEWLIKEFKKKTNIESHFELDADQTDIDKDTEINIFRICQEALTNIMKHAKATLVVINIVAKGDILDITITDNGKGIETGILKDPLSSGLLNMRERANLINAQITITSSANKGTSIELIANRYGKKNIDS
jgi:two-component system, NarL family, sensor histidine kinase UhpB